LSPKWYSLNVQITLNIPDEVAERLIAGGKDPAEATLEALAVEGYRTETYPNLRCGRCSGSRLVWKFTPS
jgi:hypothetical protein